jgi:hypothetical protein
MLASAWIAGAQSGYSRGHAWWEAGQGGYLTRDDTFDNPDGQVTLVNRKGAVQTQGHPFFEALGANGRACVTCHQPADAMSISTATLRTRWNETNGRDPIFAAVDGSNCPDLPQDRRESHSLLLERGLFRIALPWPPRTKPEFRIEVVRDPTGCNTGRHLVSVYRRPRVAANLDQIAAGPQGKSFMSDGREPNLESQAISAILIHEQAASHPTLEQLRQIVDFETQLYMAQSADIRAGLLNEKDGPAVLGPQNLAAGKAALGQAPDDVLRLFDVWRKARSASDSSSQIAFRASVARGGDVFFAHGFRDRGAAVTCASCHAAGMTRWMDIGTANTADLQDAPDLPMFRITCETSGKAIYTHDPGRGLISGKCADVGAIVLGPIRGLAARAPYFSNGSARTLRDVVEFYDRRFGIGYTEQEKQDLVNFLNVL